MCKNVLGNYVHVHVHRYSICIAGRLCVQHTIHVHVQYFNFISEQVYSQGILVGRQIRVSTFWGGREGGEGA